MKKICFIQGKIGPNGVFYLNLSLIEEFITSGYAVELITNQMPHLAKNPLPPSCSLVVLEAKSMRQFFIMLFAHLRKSKPSALFASSWPLSVISAVATRVANPAGLAFCVEHVDFRTNLEISGEFTSKDKLLIKTIGRFLYAFAHKVVCVSSGVADGLKDQVGLRQKKLVIINNPVRLFRENQDDSEKTKNALGFFRSGDIKLLSVGRLVRQKNFPLLIEAIASMHQRDLVRLLIIGEGTERSDLEKLIEQRNLSSNVFLAGHLTDPSPFYREADLFVMSSSSEGFGNVLIEAMSFGTPVVSTDCLSGPAEILEQGRWGTLTPVNDCTSLTNAITSALTTSHDKAAIRRRAMDFLPAKIAEKYIDLINLTAKNRGNKSW